MSNGDTIFKTDIKKGEKELLNKYDLIILKKMKDFQRYGVIELNSNNKIISFQEKYIKSGLINRYLLY